MELQKFDELEEELFELYVKLGTTEDQEEENRILEELSKLFDRMEDE